MDALGFGELEARAGELDAAALAAPDIDRFCSSSSWVLAAAEALEPAGEPLLAAGPAGFLAMAIRRRGEVSIAEALEASWGLTCPLVGPDPSMLAAAAVGVLRAREKDWQLAMISGLPVGSPLLAATVRLVGLRYRIGRGPVTRRHVASLAGGVDGFLARRSRSLRKGLRRATARVAAEGISIEPVAVPPAGSDALHRRILSIEQRSWKGRDGAGLVDPPMGAFYRSMLRRLSAAGSARCLIARRGEEEVGFVLGAVLGDTYRGLQFSHDERFRHLALGNLLQLHQVMALAAGEPSVARYDLGTGGDYKRAWAETVSDSVCLVAASR